MPVLSTSIGLTTALFEATRAAENPFTFTLGAAAGVTTAAWFHAHIDPNSINEDELSIEAKNRVYAITSAIVGVLPSCLLRVSTLVEYYLCGPFFAGARIGFMVPHTIRHIGWLHNLAPIQPVRDPLAIPVPENS